MSEIVAPALYVVLGSGLGFIASQSRDYLQARRGKKFFLIAIGMELDALAVQLSGSLTTVKQAHVNLSGGARKGPTFAGTWRTTVFTEQVGKLRDVADPLLIEIIHFYSDLAILAQLVEKVNDIADDFDRANVGDQEGLRPTVLLRLGSLQQTLSVLSEQLEKLRAKLPRAPSV